MARQMCEEGVEVGLLFLLDPTIPGQDPFFNTPAVQHLERLARLRAREN